MSASVIIWRRAAYARSRRLALTLIGERGGRTAGAWVSMMKLRVPPADVSWFNCLLTSADILHTLRRISKEEKPDLLEDVRRPPQADAFDRRAPGHRPQRVVASKDSGGVRFAGSR